MKHQIIIYQKSEPKPILLTSNQDISDEELENKLLQCFSSNSVTKFKTDMDTVLIRPSEISSILISKREIFDNPKTEKKKYMADLGDDGETK